MKPNLMFLTIFALTLSAAPLLAEHSGGGAKGVGPSTTRDGLTCRYSGKKQIISAAGCTQVCFAEVSCTGPQAPREAKTNAVCKALNGRCPSANNCVDDDDVSVGDEARPVDPNVIKPR